MAGNETLTVGPDEAGMRLDRWFKAHYPDLAFGHLQKLLRSGQVRVDGGRVKTNARLEPGQAVRVPPLGSAGDPAAAKRTGPAPSRGGVGEGSSRGLRARDPLPSAPRTIPDRAGDRLSPFQGEGPKQSVSRRAGRAPSPERGGVGEGSRREFAARDLLIEDRLPSLQRQGSKPSARRGSAEKSDAEFLRSILLHEDDQIFVFNKPAGLAVQGGSGLTRHVDAMLEALRDKKDQKPRLVHRLDRDTSGVLVVARTRLAASRLAASFRSRSTRKIYWALVKGVPRPAQGRVSTWLAKGEGAEGEKMRVARHGEDAASHAVSLYSVVDHAGQKLAWLSMRPVTGRTHQLRAHAAHIGHPIVGDPKYFDVEGWDLPGGMQNKLHLHARRIVMPHPAGGTIDVTAPLPPHMQQSWNLLGFDAEGGGRDPEEELAE